MKHIAVACAVVLLLSGCAGAAGADGSEREPGESPAALLDLWRVSDHGLDYAETFLRFDATEFQLWQECSVVYGAWSASGDLILAEPLVAAAWPECLLPPGPPVVEWLQSVRGFDVVERGIVHLLDADGDRVATLTLDGAPVPVGDHDRELVTPPVVDEQTRASFDVAALPAGVQAPADLAGRWVPTEVADPEVEPFVEFLDSGTWEGSDGCNGVGGSWAMNEAGSFVATTGVSTLIWCDGAPVGAWLSEAALVGLDGDELVLYAADATELGRFARE